MLAMRGQCARNFFIFLVLKCMESKSENERDVEEKISISMEEFARQKRDKFVNLIAELIVKISIKEYHEEKGDKVS